MKKADIMKAKKYFNQVEVSHYHLLSISYHFLMIIWHFPTIKMTFETPEGPPDRSGGLQRDLQIDLEHPVERGLVEPDRRHEDQPALQRDLTARLAEPDHDQPHARATV